MCAREREMCASERERCARGRERCASVGWVRLGGGLKRGFGLAFAACSSASLCLAFSASFSFSFAISFSLSRASSPSLSLSLFLMPKMSLPLCGGAHVCGHKNSKTSSAPVSTAIQGPTHPYSLLPRLGLHRLLSPLLLLLPFPLPLPVASLPLPLPHHTLLHIPATRHTTDSESSTHRGRRPLCAERISKPSSGNRSQKCGLSWSNSRQKLPLKLPLPHKP